MPNLRRARFEKCEISAVATIAMLSQETLPELLRDLL